MRLLILTQTVDKNDPILGFFHRWIEEYARHCEHVIVICLNKGEYALPDNVTVLSLGKREGKGRLTYLFRFFRYTWAYRHEYDAVFVHMNQVYVLLGGLVWHMLGKRVGLWYAHGTTSFSLRVATWLTDIVFTSTPEGFRIPSEKVRVVGQGIDTELFSKESGDSPDIPKETHTYDIRIVTVGRISSIKQCEVVIEAVRILHERGECVSAVFVGETKGADALAYEATLREQVHKYGLEDRVTFTGGVSPDRVRTYLQSANVCVNPSATGSLDKVGLEAMVAGVPLVTSNSAFIDILSGYTDRLMFPEGDVEKLVEQVLALTRSEDRTALITALTKRVRLEHGITTLVPRILNMYT